MTAEMWAVPEVMKYELLSVKETWNTENFHGVMVDPLLNCCLLRFLVYMEQEEGNEQLGNTISEMKNFIKKGVPENPQEEYDEEQAILSYNIMVYCCVKAKCFKRAVIYLLKSFKLSPSKYNTAYGYVKCIIQIFRHLTESMMP